MLTVSKLTDFYEEWQQFLAYADSLELPALLAF